MAKWKLVNSENVEPYVCSPDYSSKIMTGDEMAGGPVVNINEGTLKAGKKNPGPSGGGEAHEDTEIYYIIECGDSYVVLDDESLPVKAGDIIVIPGGTRHYIDNTKSDTDFRLFTFWPRQEQNGVYHERLKDWGTSVRYKDKDYTEKRLKSKK